MLLGLAGDPLHLAGLNYKDRPENARRFLGELGNPYGAVGIDERPRRDRLGVYGVPETFMVGRDGTILYKHVGPLSAETLPAFREALARARTWRRLSEASRRLASNDVGALGQIWHIVGARQFPRWC